jgi:integration host factor subunit beta
VIKSQLTLNVAGQFFHLPHRVVEKAVDVVLDEIVTAMARKDRVELRGFGAFSVKDRAGRIGRNPQSGVKVEVPEKSVPVFRSSKEIGRRLNPVVWIPESSERISRRSR